MANGPHSYIFTKGWGAFVEGQKIDPPCVMSGTEFKILYENGTLVVEHEYKEPKKRGRPPKEVVETADAPPAAERAVLTSAPRPARLQKAEVKASKKEDKK